MPRASSGFSWLSVGRCARRRLPLSEDRLVGTMISSHCRTGTSSASPRPIASSINAFPGNSHLLPQRVPPPLISRLPAALAISCQTPPKRVPTPRRCPRRSRLSLAHRPWPSLASRPDAALGSQRRLDFPTVNRNRFPRGRMNPAYPAGARPLPDESGAPGRIFQPVYKLSRWKIGEILP